jgi:SAM-dependent methyltransferase
MERTDKLEATRFEGQSSGSGSVSPADLGYFARRDTGTVADFNATYWGTVVDPDGVRRDRTGEREQALADLAIELDYIRRQPPGRVLDVGCGLGFLLSGVPETWERHGVEVSEFAARYASAYGTVHVGDLASARFDDSSFDVVVLHHVIEHVDEPVALGREIFRVLRPNGKLILGTPDFDGAMARRFGARYRLLHDPTHVSLFTNESMHRFLRDLGFVIERVEYPFFETRHFSRENVLRLFDTTQVSPPFYGSFMTFFCRKPAYHDLHEKLMRISRAANELSSVLSTRIDSLARLLAERVRAGGQVFAPFDGNASDKWLVNASSLSASSRTSHDVLLTPCSDDTAALARTRGIATIAVDDAGKSVIKDPSFWRDVQVAVLEDVRTLLAEDSQ